MGPLVQPRVEGMSPQRNNNVIDIITFAYIHRVRLTTTMAIVEIANRPHRVPACQLSTTPARSQLPVTSHRIKLVAFETWSPTFTSSTQANHMARAFAHTQLRRDPRWTSHASDSLPNCPTLEYAAAGRLVCRPPNRQATHAHCSAIARK